MFEDFLTHFKAEIKKKLKGTNDICIESIPDQQIRL